MQAKAFADVCFHDVSALLRAYEPFAGRTLCCISLDDHWTVRQVGNQSAHGSIDLPLTLFRQFLPFARLRGEQLVVAQPDAFRRSSPQEFARAILSGSHLIQGVIPLTLEESPQEE